MNEAEIKAKVLSILTEVAPEIDLAAIKPEVAFHEQFDFDSMDFLNFSTALSERLGIEIRDNDYPRLASLNGCLAYLSERLEASAQETLAST